MVHLVGRMVEANNLFSKHYLETRLKESKEWDCLGHDEVFEKLRERYAQKKSLLEGYREAQLDDNFIKPILKYLGHSFEVQQPGDTSRLTPDHVFYPNEETQKEAHEKKEYYKKAIALGDAKSWTTQLDKTHKGREEVINNPSVQIDGYLRKNDVRWGILTNGKYWRLYFIETSYRMNSYYQVDLEALLEEGDLEKFKYFFLFFRREAFIKDETGECFLDRVQSQSNKFAKEIGDDLEKRVYKALRVMAQGFVDRNGNNITLSEAGIRELHENCLIFLYRLLFIFYADSRDMLKVPIKAKSFDINWIRARAVQMMRKGEVSPYTIELYNHLTELFNLIDVGSEGMKIPRKDMYIPPYNGGLFHSEEHKFLRDKKVGDDAVAEVLELLTKSGNGGSGSIDYSTLEIRHLGSIYEGLLEYKLKVAQQDRVAVKEKGGEVWIPKEKAADKTFTDSVSKGKLYLATDKGERKATGSYYTPDYIVKYIVENTLGPVVEEKLMGATTDKERRESLFSIRVLDPAMGSGHFLVEAAEFLASKVANYIDPEEIGEETDKEWASREVVKRCIYGVDLNPLATELAKLSLWLNSISRERPLSFLDHHLKVGNSLIGADIYKLDKHPSELKAWETLSQVSLSTFMRASIRENIDRLLDMYNWIMERAEEKIEDIKYKEQVFGELMRQPLRKRFIELANLHTSYYFGNEYSKSEYEEALRAFQEGAEAWAKIREKEYFKRTQEIARDKDFYHWKLEFPEVFFEPGKDKENPGFDCVIGNPPYGSIFSEEEKSYLKPHFQSVHQIFDAFATFIEKSIHLIAKGKFLGFIVPSGWLTARMHLPLRTLILQRCKIPYIVHLPYDVFPDAYIDTIIFIANRTETMDKAGHTNVMRFGIREDASIIASNKLEYEKIDNSFWWEDAQNRFLTTHPKILEIQRKIDKIKIDANNLLNVSRGITPFKEVDEAVQNMAEGFFGSIGRYELEGVFKPVIYDNSLAEFKPEKYFKGPRLIIRRIISRQHRIHATYVDEDFVISKSYLPALMSHPDYSLLYILALINSCLFSKNFIWSSEIAKRDDFPQLDIATVRELSIRRISFTTPKEERSKLVEELKSLYSEGNFDAILTKTEGCLPKDEEGNFIIAKEKSDVVHDFLGFLAEQMIEMNKEKNKEIKGFLEWLEGYTKLKVDDITLKSKIREYYKYDWEEMRRILVRNKRKIKEFDVIRREPQEKVKEEYEASMAKLKPLLERIKETDGLIDQVVYRLYGLTEEEIKVVEGTKG